MKVNIKIPGEFYDGSYVNDINKKEITLRPSIIVRGYLKHYRKKKGCSPDQARTEFSIKTGISEGDIRRIEDGELPTSLQLHKIADAFKWSMFFIFGIDGILYEHTERMFFQEISNLTPSLEDRNAFKELYQQCLLQKLEDERRGN